MSEKIFKVTCKHCGAQVKVRDSVYQKRIQKLAKLLDAENNGIKIAAVQQVLDDSYMCRACRKQTFNLIGQPVKKIKTKEEEKEEEKSAEPDEGLSIPFSAELLEQAYVKEELDSHYCPICSQHYSVHNDDGSCVSD